MQSPALIAENAANPRQIYTRREMREKHRRGKREDHQRNTEPCSCEILLRQTSVTFAISEIRKLSDINVELAEKFVVFAVKMELSDSSS